MEVLGNTERCPLSMQAHCSGVGMMKGHCKQVSLISMHSFPHLNLECFYEGGPFMIHLPPLSFSFSWSLDRSFSLLENWTFRSWEPLPFVSYLTGEEYKSQSSGCYMEQSEQCEKGRFQLGRDFCAFTVVDLFSARTQVLKP